MKVLLFENLLLTVVTVFASDSVLKRGVPPYRDAYSIIAPGENSDALIRKIVNTADLDLNGGKEKVDFFIAHTNMPAKLRQDFNHSFDFVKGMMDKVSFVRGDDEEQLRKVVIDSYAGIPFFKKLIRQLKQSSMQMSLAYPFEHVLLRNSPCTRWNELGNLQEYIWPANLSVLVSIRRISGWRICGNAMAKAYVFGEIRPAITNSVSFEPIDASYDLAKMLCVVYTNNHLSSTDGNYALVDSVSSRIIPLDKYLPGEIIAKSISGDGSVVGYDEYDEDLGIGTARVIREGMSVCLFPELKGVRTRVTDASFDGNTVICEYWDCENYSGPRTALYSQSGISILNPFGAVSEEAIACMGKTVSSNGCVVAGVSFDVATMKNTAFIKRAGEDMLPLRGPVSDGEFLSSDVLAMSRNGRYVVGVTSLEGGSVLHWIYDGHSYRSLIYENTGIEAITPCCITDTGGMIFGMASAGAVTPKPFMIKDGRIGIIDTGNNDVSITGIVAASGDGRTALCRGFKKGFGEVGVYVDIIRVQ